jgi:dTDP-4-dehydrorhamnose 3,5-epimerase
MPVFRAASFKIITAIRFAPARSADCIFRPPHAQAKLVRCASGAIWDVAVDIRSSSPTYGRWVGAALTAAGGEQPYVPVGFAHGFITLTDDVHVLYKASEIYAPAAEGAIAWNDLPHSSDHGFRSTVANSNTVPKNLPGTSPGLPKRGCGAMPQATSW